MSERITTTVTIEECGKGQQCGIEFEVEWDITPGEPRVMYDRDGSGYPGSAPYAEPIDVVVTAAWGEDWMAVRRPVSYPHEQSIGMRIINAPNWLDSLTPYCELRMETDLLDAEMERALQAADEQVEEAKAVAAETRWEMMREGEWS